MHRLARTRVAPAALRSCAAAALAFALVLGCSSVASAAPVLDAGYTSATSTTSCGYNGQFDENGVMYAMCGSKIARWDKNGTKLADIAVPKGLAQTAYDVAPSPDGAYLYLTQDSTTPRRLNRTATGTYTLDAAWKLAPVVVWNEPSLAMGRFIATDGRGDIYLSNGSITTAGQRSVAKFTPAGTLITAFGDWGKEPGNWITNQGIAVSRDGRRVFVGENCGTNCIYGTAGYDASRITRYDFTPGGTYRFSHILSTTGATGGKSYPECEVPGAVHSGYGVAMDYWDNVYVTSVTCGRIQMFHTDVDPAKDAFVKSIVAWDDQPRRSHYISSDWAGRLHTVEWNMIFTPKTPKVPATPLPKLEPLPTPDTKAPVLSNITVPTVTTTQTIQIGITATDDRSVAEMQLAHEDGTWGPWQPFATPVAYELSDDFGIKGVYVRVRDMGGNESQAVYRTLSYQEAPGPDEPPVGATPDGADPILTSVRLPALTATRDVQVTLDATDDTAVKWMRFANEDGNWAAWKAFAATSTWSLSANVGPKAVYAQVRDASGRESGTMMARTSYQLDAPGLPPGGGGGAPDTTAPALTGFTLPAESTTQTVSAALVATDAVGVAQVRFANEDGNWTAWQAWGATRQWTLSAGYGAKLVYAQVRDASGNESLVLTARTSWVKTLAGPVDAADPALRSVTVPETSATANIDVQLDATDDVGVTQVRFANEDGNWTAWRAYDERVPWTLSAGSTLKVVYAQVRDAAGRESNVLFARTQVTG